MTPETVAVATLPRRRVGGTGLELSILGVGGWLGLLDTPPAAGSERDHTRPSDLWNGLSSDRAKKRRPPSPPCGGPWTWASITSTPRPCMAMARPSAIW